MKKIIVALLVTACIVPTVLFAGGGKEQPRKVSVEYTPNGTYPIVKTPITVDIMVAQPPCVEDYNTNRFSKYMEEKTGIKVNYIMVPEQAATEKLALTLASGDYPDAFLGFNIKNDLEATYGAQEHLFMPLNKYYTKEWMPHLTAALNQYPGGLGYMTNIDGNIYSLPRLEGCFHCTNMAKMYVYRPFLDALGLPVPTTTEEFYQVLKTIKAQDPNGNGKPDEIPLAGSIIGWGNEVERFILNSFIYSDLTTDINQNAEDNVGYMMNGKKVDTSVNKDAYREGLAYVNKLYREGLIYNGSFTQDSSQLTQLVESSQEPVMGFVAGGWRGQFSTIGGERFSQFQAIAPLKGPNGVQETPNFLANPEIGKLVISADSEYAEAIIRYFDYMYSQEGTLMQRNGFIGEAWDWAKSNQVGLDGNPAIWEQLRLWNDKDPQNDTWIQVLIGAMTFDLKNGLANNAPGADDPAYYLPSNNEKTLYDETAKLYKPYAHPELEVPTLKYTAEENEKFSTVKRELANFIRQSAVKFMVGTLDVNNDKVWNDYLANLERLQLSKVLDLMQTAYDRQYK
ncbi:ABC transporter substrate-binding protein [Parasphaerochaeta coccoides]|uniref:Extracellular solute-binding protein family 1 n=1 Tax=Parasphaerochaeta coccoides (strain ATCC BAA-1237 / DSM 17374 / SPN1) TaxID=760011 RepID=F4GHQ3_PARC1|nr:ABC transporter substrate-binding protein [Parasphaerochaeta coccoides]AEC01591.1 extracellular solute-binding protein family 1 [Parasphaerochaeta coccoides DSM 17374]